MSGAATTSEEDELGLRDRRGANLPLLLNGFDPVHGKRTRKVRFGRDRLATLVAALGLALAVAGTVLAFVPVSVPVYRNGTEVHVGGSVLIAQGADHFAGNGALVLRTNTDGSVDAGGSAQAGTQTVTGRCHYTPATAREECTFRVGSAAFSATDVLSGTGATRLWTRRYSDGKELTMPVPAGTDVVPVPFAVGH